MCAGMSQRMHFSLSENELKVVAAGCSCFLHVCLLLLCTIVLYSRDRTRDTTHTSTYTHTGEEQIERAAGAEHLMSLLRLSSCTDACTIH